ncbi:DNA polymerase III subunit delta [Gudongella sp. SC589]|jgi:DNA polymerase-3 subunit delta|uniref:DNA polymerase III subunit delta n=1 Tax=Gudongella sp. SC589 TaxID=3385990 RepID=UPI003904C766
MKYIEFQNSIENGNINPIYIFTGEETYLLDIAVEQLVGLFMTKEGRTINLANLDGKTAGLEDLKASCETLPFMSERRVTVLRGAEALLDKDSSSDEMLDYVKSLGDHQLLLINDRDGKIKKNTKFYRYLNKAGSAVVFEKLKGKELADWIHGKLAERGKTMSYADLNYFIQQSSYNSRNISTTLYDLDNEIKKLADYASGKNIDRIILDQVLIKTLDKNIFDFLGAVGKNDTDRAMEVFNEIYLMNEPVPRILFMISRQFRLLLGYVTYREKGYGSGEIQEKLRIKPYEFGKIAAQGNGMDRNRLRDILEEILQTDRNLKTTSSDQRLEMEMLIVKLTTSGRSYKS